MKKGFSLLENLVGLTVFFLIVCGTLEFFGTARRVFFRLRAREESCQAAWAALDRIRADVLAAGQGLARPMRLGLVSGFEQADGRWVLLRAGAAPRLTADAVSGQTRLTVSQTEETWSGRILAVFEANHGEIVEIQSSADGILELSTPLASGYRSACASVAILQKTTLYLDDEQHILRRKADASPAQPLCENVHSFDLAFEAGRALAAVRLALASAPEKSYALTILARNTALGNRF